MNKNVGKNKFAIYFALFWRARNSNITIDTW